LVIKKYFSVFLKTGTTFLRFSVFLILENRAFWCAKKVSKRFSVFFLFSITNNRVFRVFPCFWLPKIVFFAFFRVFDSQKSCFSRFFVLLILKNRVFRVFPFFRFSKIVFFVFFCVTSWWKTFFYKIFLQKYFKKRFSLSSL